MNEDTNTEKTKAEKPAAEKTKAEKPAAEKTKAEKPAAEKTKAEKPAADPMEELVDFTVPYDPSGKKKDVLIGVNGETVRVKMGVTVRIKRKFVEAWNNSQAQVMEAMMARDRAQEAGKAPVASL